MDNKKVMALCKAGVSFIFALRTVCAELDPSIVSAELFYGRIAAVTMYISDIRWTSNKNIVPTISKSLVQRTQNALFSALNGYL